MLVSLERLRPRRGPKKSGKSHVFFLCDWVTSPTMVTSPKMARHIIINNGTLEDG